MNKDAVLLAAVVFPLLAGIVIGLQRQERLRNILVLAALLAELGMVGYLCIGEHTLTVWQMTPRLSLAYHTDAISKLFAGMICVIWLLAGIYSFAYMKREEHPERFFLFYVMTLGALVSLSFASNMLTLYLSYEYMTLLTLPLVIHSRTKEAVRAGVKYLGYSMFGAGLGLLGFFFLDTYCTTTAFVPGGSLNPQLLAGNEALLLVVYFLMMLGFGCKAGMFPLHGWLPTAHPVAPSPASAVLSGVITKGGVLAIIRVTFYLVGADLIRGTWVQTSLLLLAIVTIFMGSMLAYQEKLLKRRLAYSTISQVSYALFGLFLLHPIGFLGALLQVVSHAVAKNILFLSAGVMIAQTKETSVFGYRGTAKAIPAVMWAFCLGALSLIGIPPFAGFISKWYLAEGGLSPAFGTLGVVGVAVFMLSALLTAGYLLPIVLDAFFPGAQEDTEEREKTASVRWMTLPLILLAAGAVLLGIAPGGWIDWVAQIGEGIFEG